MDWFNYMKEQGFFDPSKNPTPVAVENGFQIPSWDVLDYLEKVASTFPKGENLELVPEILYIIKQVSENPVDNYRTWYRIIKILSFVPNRDVSEEYINYIPVWVHSQFDTMLQTIEICKSLLPKFVNQNSSDLDIKKADKILSYLFSIVKDERTKQGDGYNTLSYKSPYYLYQLNQSFHEKELIINIAQKSSLSPIYNLINSINILLRDSQIKVQGKIQEIVYDFILERNFHKIKITVFKITNESHTEIYANTLENYLDLPVTWNSNELKEIFEKCLIDKSIFDEIDEKIDFALKNDFISLFGYNAIKDLEAEADSSEKTLNTFSYILRELLIELSIQKDKVKINEVFNNFLDCSRYNIPFFKRMMLYVIAKNWKVLKPWFWKLIGENDDLSIFSIDSYKLELYFLLSTVGQTLNDKEAEKITKILNAGPKYEKYGNPDKAYWQHRWLDALKESKYFKDWYLTLSQEKNFKSDYSDEGKIKVRVGDVSPFTIDEINEMDDDTLLLSIKNFKSLGGWEDPTVDGLASTLGKAAEEYPQRFASLLIKFENLELIYCYYILNGFNNAWRTNKDFNWDEVLEFCWKYITSEAFRKDELISERRLNVHREWIYGDIASLISTGAQYDNHSFDNHSLPLVKQILLRINKDLISKEVVQTIGIDFVMHMLNSTSGKLLKALLDYTLKNARNLLDHNSTDRWDYDVKIIYNQKLEEASVEAYTILGMYLSQFMYLDNDWLITKLKSVDTLNNQSWRAFMGGLSYGRPLSKDYYDLLYLNFTHAIKNKEFCNNRGQGLIRHFFAYFLWDYEDTYEQSLIYNVLQNNADVVVLNNLITLLNQQLKSNKNDSMTDTVSNQKIFTLWKTINLAVKQIKDKNDLKQLRSIIYLSDVIEKLDNENISLIEDNLNMFGDDMINIHLLNSILRWTENSSPELIARLLGKLKLGYIYDKEIIIKLVEYLYLNNETKTANQISTKLAIDGYDFINPLYQKYNF